jgi:hypothetical protein
MTTVSVALIELARQAMTVEGQAAVHRAIRLLRGPAALPLGAFVAGAAAGAAVGVAAAMLLSPDIGPRTRERVRARVRTLLKRGNGAAKTPIESTQEARVP